MALLKPTGGLLKRIAPLPFPSLHSGGSIEARVVLHSAQLSLTAFPSLHSGGSIEAYLSESNISPLAIFPSLHSGGSIEARRAWLAYILYRLHFHRCIAVALLKLLLKMYLF